MEKCRILYKFQNAKWLTNILFFTSTLGVHLVATLITNHEMRHNFCCLFRPITPPTKPWSLSLRIKCMSSTVFQHLKDENFFLHSKSNWFSTFYFVQQMASVINTVWFFTCIENKSIQIFSTVWRISVHLPKKQVRHHSDVSLMLCCLYNFKTWCQIWGGEIYHVNNLM